MRIFGKPTARQKEIRRARAERRPNWYQRLGERTRLQPLALLLLGAVGAAVIVNAGREVLDLRVGQRVPRALSSRVAFRIEDPQRTRDERTIARNNADDYYTLDASLLQDIRGRLSNVLLIAREQAADRQKLRDEAERIKVLFDEAGLDEIIRIANLPDSSDYEATVDRAVRTLRRQPLVEAGDPTQRPEADDQVRRQLGLHANLLDPDQPTPKRVSIHELLFDSVRDDVVKVAEAAADVFTRPLRKTVKASLLEMLRGAREGTFKPLYRYNAARSEQAAQQAANTVQAKYIEHAVDSLLADAGEIQLGELELLQEEHRQYLALREADPEARAAHWWAVGARALITFLVVLGLGGYILLRHEKSLSTVQRRRATGLALLLVLILARSALVSTGMAHLAVGAQAFAVSLLAITSRRSATQAASALLALMIVLATRQGIGFLVILAAVSVVLFLGLRDVRNRGRVIAIGALAALVALVTTVLIGVVDGQSLAFIFWNQALWAGLTTLAAVFIVEGILPGIERLFGITTSMTLLEWCDPNKQVLRMLAADAPGTYNHSLLVGALADAAATAIGTNGLLARAGAYYHDIGKVNKPEYFVENQGLGVDNRHERLSPAMSHLIIIGHVKDGIAMAKEYGVPAGLHPFIPEHHGTCVVEYFYHAATQARKPGDPEVPDTQFRYPGPKPRSRETAIVMMCDAVEGAVRAMPEPTPGRIEDTVARTIQKRLTDGQFDECDLTFRELAAIRSSLVKSLNSIYHARIAYPSAEKPAEKPPEKPTEKPPEKPAESRTEA